MTAITARKDVRRQEAVILPFPIAATTKIVEGALVNVNAAGYAVNATDTTGERCVGVASQETDNTAGAAGDADAIVWTGGAIDVTTSFSATIANVGDKVYVVDNQTVDLAAVTTNDVLVGVIVAVLSTSKVRVILTPYA
mgnify:CR=1 FL=1